MGTHETGMPLHSHAPRHREPRRPVRRAATLGLAAMLALSGVACGGDPDSDQASATDDSAPTSPTSAGPTAAASSPVAPTAVASSPVPSASPDSADATTTPPPVEAADGDFCDELETFLNAWVIDEIAPADLTDEYLRLASMAPGELVDDLEQLAEGNEQVLANDDEVFDTEAYDEAGAAVITYAMGDCGIQLEN